jgi:type III secretory pathway component EscS
MLQFSVKYLNLGIIVASFAGCLLHLLVAATQLTAPTEIS